MRDIKDKIYLDILEILYNKTHRGYNAIRFVRGII